MFSVLFSSSSESSSAFSASLKLSRLQVFFLSSTLFLIRDITAGVGSHSSKVGMLYFANRYKISVSNDRVLPIEVFKILFWFIRRSASPYVALLPSAPKSLTLFKKKTDCLRGDTRNFLNTRYAALQYRHILTNRYIRDSIFLNGCLVSIFHGLSR